MNYLRLYFLKLISAIDRPPVLLFFLFFLTFGYFFHSGGHNQAARLDTVRALWEDRVLHINRFAWNTADTMSRPVPDRLKTLYPNADIFIYAAQAPGSAFWAVPIWGGVSSVLRVMLSAERNWLTLSHYFTTVIGIALPCAVALVFLFLWMREVTGRPFRSLLLVLALGLGTPFFPYATMYYSHSLTASFLFMSFYGVWRLAHIQTDSVRSWLLWSAVAGFCLTYSIALEYPAAIPAVFLLIYGALKIKSWKYRLAGICFAFLPLVLLMAYNYVLSGHLIYTPYQEHVTAHSNFPNYRAGFLGLVFPSWAILKELLVRPQRGLLFLSPWLLLALMGWFRMGTQKKYPLETLLWGAIILAHLVFNSCMGSSWAHIMGGHACGPRHMIPVLFFFVLPIAFLSDFWDVYLVPLVLWSIAILTASTAVNPEFPYVYNNPVFQFIWPNFIHGNFGILSGPTFTTEQLIPESYSWNVGRLFGLRGGWQLMPLGILWMVIGGSLIWEFRSNKIPADHPIFSAPPQPGDGDNGRG